MQYNTVKRNQIITLLKDTIHYTWSVTQFCIWSSPSCCIDMIQYSMILDNTTHYSKKINTLTQNTIHMVCHPVIQIWDNQYNLIKYNSKQNKSINWYIIQYTWCHPLLQMIILMHHYNTIQYNIIQATQNNSIWYSTIICKSIKSKKIYNIRDDICSDRIFFSIENNA